MVEPPPKLSMMDHATPTTMVSAFCRAVTSYLVPKQFWGTGDLQQHNKEIFDRNIDRFIGLRRFESLSLHEVSQGLKASHTSLQDTYILIVFRSAALNGWDLWIAPRIRSRKATGTSDGKSSMNFSTTSSTRYSYPSFEQTSTSQNPTSIDTDYSISGTMYGEPWLNQHFRHSSLRCSKR